MIEIQSYRIHLIGNLNAIWSLFNGLVIIRCNKWRSSNYECRSLIDESTTIQIEKKIPKLLQNSMMMYDCKSVIT